jgi:hypothetical protein
MVLCGLNVLIGITTPQASAGAVFIPLGDTALKRYPKNVKVILSQNIRGWNE